MYGQHPLHTTHNGPTLSATLGGKPTREALSVGAVVVDHEIPPHPSELGLVESIQAVERHPRPRPSVEVTVGRGEGGPAPIGLDGPASRGPLVGVPNAGVESHRLLVRETHSHSF